VAQQRRGLIVNDFRHSPYATPLLLENSTATAVLAEPLLYHDRLVGVINLNRVESHQPFGEEDRELLGLFAAQAAIAIENARLHESIRRHAAELEERVRERTQDLASANRQLEAASRYKSEFLANMSHEIRTPLNSILGFAQILQDQLKDLLTGKQVRYLSNIYTSGQHLLQLINDILDLSKVEAGKVVLRPEALPVATTLEDILVVGRGLANKKGQLIALEIEPELPPLQADPVRFKQILFNLLSNAVKFTPDQGTITVRARETKDVRPFDCSTVPGRANRRTAEPPNALQSRWLEISVRDTGVGIRPEDLPRLFQEFIQLETTRAQHHEGTGLGLALTKRLVELHGGRIWAESEGEGKGSTFTVALPFAGAGETRD
jgi:Amt family ammonium transporter